jgi:peptidoglycan/xylan/chitin deacetylase (PgdA/CDA1 family)
VNPLALVAGAGILLLLFFVLRFGLFIPATRGLPVLMYHRFAETSTDNLTVATKDFEQQLRYLNEAGYRTISIAQLLAFVDGREALPDKPVLITLDDAYLSHLELAAPVLAACACRAVVFVPAGLIGRSNPLRRGPEPLLDAEQLKNLDGNVLDIGLHSFSHKNYGSLTAEEVERDIRACIDSAVENGIPFAPVFAYPYGGRPEDEAVYRSMIESLTRGGIRLGFRIGNRVNRLPLKDLFEIKRINIQGGDSMWTFRTKLAKGRVKQV